MTFIKNNKFFLIGLLVLFWVIFINLFPSGYVFGGGDTNQLIEAKDSFENLFFDWYGRASFFYGIFYFLSLIGISNSVQLSFYLGFIIFGSYFSFWFFSKLLFPKAQDLPKSLISLFYALNLYTLFLFTGNWGYSYFPSLYVFIPILIGLYLKFLDSQKIIYGFGFCLFLFLASPGFCNSAFALSFAVLFLFLTIFILYVKKIVPTKKFIGKIIFIIFLSFLVSAFWIFPTVPQVKIATEGLLTTNVIDFNSWMRSTSNPIHRTFSLIHYSEMHFPLNFYFKKFDFLKSLFILISFFPILLIIFGSYLSRNIEKKYKIMIFSSLGLFSIFIMLVARFRFPFEIINYYIYSLPGFVTLRGYDKTAIYIPFLISSLLLLTAINIKKRKLFYILMFFALLAPLPFYFGKLQQTAGYRVNSEKNYREAKMSFLVKIPQEYYSIREKLNSDLKKSKIATLPNTYSDGSGISYFPKWNFYGVDITRYLYNKSLLDASASRYIFTNWSYAYYFNEINSPDESWIVKILGMMNSQYILFHKDAPEEDVQKSLPKMKALESRGVIKNLEENDYFILYEIPEKYFLSYLSWQNGNPEIQGSITSIERNFEKVKNNSFEASFRENNPKKFTVDLLQEKIGENLVLAETFNPLWKAYYVTDSGREIEIQEHFKARGYANGWTIDKNIPAQKIIVEYYPIRLMWRGMWISGITILSLLIYLLIYYYNKFRKKKSSLVT